MATIKDIADRAGVSIGTVDRILHKRGRYSEKTAEKVHAIVKELNYSPNIHARGLKKTRSYSFGAVVPYADQEAGYWQMVVDGIYRASAELSSYCEDVRIFHFDRYSAESCQAVLTEALSSGVEGLLIAPVLPGKVLEMLKGADIPFIFIDTDIPEIKKRISYIGQDSFQSGILSGKLMSLLLSSRFKNAAEKFVLVIEPPDTNYHLQSRIEGFRSYIKENIPDSRIIYIKAESDDEKQFHEFLDAYFDIRKELPGGVFVANSLVYYFASFVKKKGGAFSSLPIIGYDLIPGLEQLIEEGIIDFILTQQPEEQSYRGIMMLYDSLVLNTMVQKEVIIPLNIITKENLHTFGS
jgi:LacI family transcriptional regulator